ncbi:MULTISPECIES: hypothetical protein [Nonomuraea]
MGHRSAPTRDIPLCTAPPYTTRRVSPAGRQGAPSPPRRTTVLPW